MPGRVDLTTTPANGFDRRALEAGQVLRSVYWQCLGERVPRRSARAFLAPSSFVFLWLWRISPSFGLGEFARGIVMPKVAGSTLAGGYFLAPSLKVLSGYEAYRNVI